MVAASSLCVATVPLTVKEASPHATTLTSESVGPFPAGIVQSYPSSLPSSFVWRDAVTPDGSSNETAADSSDTSTSFASTRRVVVANPALSAGESGETLSRIGAFLAELNSPFERKWIGASA